MKNLPRVLIVEDEPSIAELVSVNLRHNGYAAGVGRGRRRAPSASSMPYCPT